MIQKDYIMRMIEQLGKILAKVMLNKTEKNYEEAKINIESAIENLLGINSQLLLSISNQNIAELLGMSKDNSIGSMKCIIAARLIKELADIHHAQLENINVISELQKALTLYLDGIINMGYCEIKMDEYYSDINEIIRKLGINIKEETKHKLDEYYKLMKTKNG
jgi:hypothetical protein